MLIVQFRTSKENNDYVKSLKKWSSKFGSYKKNGLKKYIINHDDNNAIIFGFDKLDKKTMCIYFTAYGSPKVYREYYKYNAVPINIPEL